MDGDRKGSEGVGGCVGLWGNAPASDGWFIPDERVPNRKYDVMFQQPLAGPNIVNRLHCRLPPRVFSRILASRLSGPVACRYCGTLQGTEPVISSISN